MKKCCPHHKTPLCSTQFSGKSVTTLIKRWVQKNETTKSTTNMVNLGYLRAYLTFSSSNSSIILLRKRLIWPISPSISRMELLRYLRNWIRYIFCHY